MILLQSMCLYPNIYLAILYQYLYIYKIKLFTSHIAQARAHPALSDIHAQNFRLNGLTSTCLVSKFSLKTIFFINIC